MPRQKYAIELSPRESELIELLANGHGYKKCAEIMCVSGTTIKSHINSIFQKEQVCCLQELLCKYYKKKLEERNG